MTKTIDTLVPDIQQVLRNSLLGKGVELSVDQQAQLGAAIANKVRIALNRQTWSRAPKTLRMSEIGKPCLRQLWYTVHAPELGERLLPNTQFKFLYGDIIEELVLFLAKLSGHKVEEEQAKSEWTTKDWTVVGHQDAVIDGVLVDVKSASSYSFKKFKEGMNADNDAFGYRMQLQCYNMLKKRPMGWLAVDKQNGTMVFSPHTAPNHVNLKRRLDEITDALDNKLIPPRRTFPVIPEGRSGNMKLGVECSYCSFKKECWKDSNGGNGLRGFAYERGPVFLTHVVREPIVPEFSLETDSETAPLESADATSVGSR